MAAKEALNDLLRLGGVDLPTGATVDFQGRDPVVKSPYRLGEAAAAALGAQGAAVAALWAMRSGRGQRVTVDLAKAALSLRSVNYLRQRGYPVPFPDPAYPTIGFYKTGDQRRIMLHGGYPGLRDELLKQLNCANNAAAIAEAVAHFESGALEDLIAEHKACGTIVRSQEEWLAHPQGQALKAAPLVDIQPLGGPLGGPSGGATRAEPPLPETTGIRPLTGLRVLDLTHVLAGPTASRVLAEQGADVLRVSAPGRPVMTGFIMDTGHGKLSTLLDLAKPDDKRRFHALLSETDVLLYSYRPGGLDRLGFSEAEIARIRPGIIFASVSCYGEIGPWRERAGWEQLAQACSGMAVTQGEMEAGNGGEAEPMLSVVYPNDYVTGYLTAYGILAALLKRAKHGGGYRVRTSLCRTAMWLQSFTPVPAAPLPSQESIAITERRMMEKRETAWGPLSFMGPVTHFSATKAQWERPTTPLAHDPVLWPHGHRFSEHSPETREEARLYAREIVQM